MSPYDSDLSDEGEDFAETNVLLGFASKNSTDDAISHLGGQPAWLDDNLPPPGQFAKCKSCNGLLSLLLELNGDLPERFPGHERRLYLWSCRRKACRRKEGSIRGLRALRSSKATAQSAQAQKDDTSAKASSPPPQPRQDLGSSIFGAQPSSKSTPLNPFATSSSSASATNPFTSPSSTNPFANTASLAAKPPQRPEPQQDSTASLSQTFAEKARIANEKSPDPAPVPLQGPVEPWPAESAFPIPFPRYHLEADYETLDSEPKPIQAHEVMDIDEPTANGSSSSKEDDNDKDTFESSMDRTFQKFADRAAQNPEQVLRYEFAGQPMLYSSEDAVGRILDPHRQGASARVPRCPSCGADRVFELQLMPNAISELEAEEMGVEGMEWGTIVLMVCSKDCAPRGIGTGEVGYVEEWVGVQWEEVVKHQ